MKKNAIVTALALLITGCAQIRRLLFKQTGSSSTKGNHHPSFLRFELGRRNCRCSQNLCGAENVVKNRNPANIRKWIARNVILALPTEARVYCSQ